MKRPNKDFLAVLNGRYVSKALKQAAVDWSKALRLSNADPLNLTLRRDSEKATDKMNALLDADEADQEAAERARARK